MAIKGNLVPAEGIEPPTHALRKWSRTNLLNRISHLRRLPLCQESGKHREIEVSENKSGTKLAQC